MNEQEAPRLPGIRGDGQTLKPDELDGKTVTVLTSQVVVRRDGSTGHKWLVRHDDNTLALYWAPGMAPPQQVHQFFRQYPDHELRLLVRRNDNGDGYARWQIEQLVAPQEATHSNSDDTAVDQVPF